MSTLYFYGQGSVSFAARGVDNTIYGFTRFGDCSALTLKLGQTYGSEAILPTGLMGIPNLYPTPPAIRSGDVPMLEMQTENASLSALASMLYGGITPTNAGTVASETITAAHDQAVPLANINLSSFTSLKNSDGTVTYTQGTDYTVDLVYGTVTVLSTGTIAAGASVKAAYVHSGHTSVAVGAVPISLVSMRFEGLNLAAPGGARPVLVEVYKMRLLPLDTLPIISDNMMSSKLVGRIFRDPTRAVNSAGGNLVRIRVV